LKRKHFQIGLGRADTLELPARDGMEVWEYRPNRGGSVGDPRAAAARSLGEPCDFPAISQAVVEGDRVVLAVDANIPDPSPVIAGLLDALPIERVAAVTVLLQQEAQPETVAAAEAAAAGRAEVLVHRPDVPEQLGYLAANAAADPIYLNRRLIDADLVVPVITARPVGSLDPHTLDGGVLPAFADTGTQRRLRQETLRADGTDDREASEAAWLLGIQLIVAVLPNAEAKVAGIVAGTAAGIRRAAEHAIEASWRRDTTRRAELVFACLDGDAQQQSWENVARAVHVARHLIQPGGTIVITSRLDRPISRSLHRLATSETAERVQRRLAKDSESTALTAALLLQQRQQGRVLLFSRLPREEVEALGIGAVDRPEQLIKLAEAHASCAIVRSAQYCGIGTLKTNRPRELQSDERSE
jgi:nickel-dependent lactate racemase